MRISQEGFNEPCKLSHRGDLHFVVLDLFLVMEGEDITRNVLIWANICKHIFGFMDWSRGHGGKKDAFYFFISVQFSSVAQLYLTLCDPINRSTPGLHVHHQLQEFTQTHAQ